MRSSRFGRIGGVFILALVVGLVLAACQGGEGPKATPAEKAPVTPKPAPAAVKAWRIGLPADITTTNIWNILGPGATAYNFYAQLNRYPFLYGLSDQRFDWVPAWADGFPTPLVQEGDLWTTTVTLKKGAKWSDGKPVTAHDVAFSINTVLDFELPGNWKDKINKELVAKVEALDDLTVQYYFKKKPGLAQWQYGVSSIQFAAKHFWEPLVARTSKTDPLAERQKALYAIVPLNEPTAGEMTFVKWEKGAFVEVKENKEYFFRGTRVTEYKNGAYLQEKPGVFREVAYGEPTGEVALEFTRGPYAESVIFSVYASQDAAILALQKGDIDYMASPQGLQQGFVQQLAGKPDIRIISNAPNSIRYMGFNTRREPMNYKAFRQAVSVLVDKEFVTQTLLQGTAQSAYTVVPPGNTGWYNTKVSELGKGLTREQRVNEAVRLLKAAGFAWQVVEPKWDALKRAVEPGKGLRMPNGKPVPELGLLAPSAGYDPQRATFALWIEQWLEDVGIPVKADLTGFNVIVQKAITEQDMDMWILGWGLGVFPDYVGNFFHSKRAGKGDNNMGGYSNPEFDRLADGLVAETDIAKAKELAFRAQEILADEAPYVVLFTVQILEPVRTRVRFPYETALDGLQVYLPNANGPLSFTKLE